MLAFAIAAIAVLAAVLIMAMTRRGAHRHGLDLGAVSTRWLSELRRDEPWTR